MPLIAVQGIRGGVGATSVTVGLAWALHCLGARVLLLDLCAANQLRLHFNMPVGKARGWMNNPAPGSAIGNGAMSYATGLDFIPFGFPTRPPHLDHRPVYAELGAFARQLLIRQQYDWVLLDLPNQDLADPAISHLRVDHTLLVVKPDANCHVRLAQQPADQAPYLLLNKFSPESALQQDLVQLWGWQHPNLCPVRIHTDEAVAESLVYKQPTGEYQPASLAAEEFNTLANWCLLSWQGSPACLA